MTESSTEQRLPPGPSEQFDIGSTPDSLSRMTALFAEHGDIFRVHAPGRRRDTYVISHPDDIKRVLVSQHRNYTKGVGIDRVKVLLGHGIMVSEGELWKRQRRMIQPMFHPRVIERFAETIHDCNLRVAERWEGHARRGTPLDITEETSRVTLDVVLRSIFGEDLERLIDMAGENPFTVVSEETERNLVFAMKFRALTKLVRRLVEQRRSEGRSHFDFLGMLLEARDKDTGEPMPDRQLIDEVMTLIVAGHETTASALTWTWYLLARHADADARLYEELAGRPEQPSGDLQYIESLTYANQVINEALRLYPPGWLVTRRCIGSDVLAGYEVPAGTDVFISPYLVHRHPRYWADPDRFDPRRFSAGQADGRPRYVFIPFVAGPRHCVGETFAMFEMVHHVDLLARRFRLRALDTAPVEIEAAINLRPKHAIMLQPELR